MDEPLKEGLFDMEENIYRRLPALNITYAKLFNRSPLHVYTAINDPNAVIVSPTEAMNQGTLFHWGALEPSKLKSHVAIDPGLNKNSNAYKEWAASQNGKLIAKDKDIRNVEKMVKVLQEKNNSAMQFISDGWAEKSIIWYEEDFNIWCKGRIDWIRSDGMVLADLKKTQNASRWAFERAIYKYDYYVQAAHYMRGYSKIMGYRPDKWVWIVSEWEAPNECNTFVADPVRIEEAEINLEFWYQRYSDCLKTGEWEGYTDEPIYLGVAPVDEYEDEDIELDEALKF